MAIGKRKRLAIAQLFTIALVSAPFLIICRNARASGQSSQEVMAVQIFGKRVQPIRIHSIEANGGTGSLWPEMHNNGHDGAFW